MSEQPREPTEEELRQALEEQMSRITVKDVLLQTVVTLVNLSARKLGLAGEGDKDLEQARLGIEGVRALVPLLPEQDAASVRDALSQLQLAYAREAGTGHGPRATGHGPEAPAPEQGQAEPSSEEAERAKARAKIWTPPGA
jgi:hypothetical protein